MLNEIANLEKAIADEALSIARFEAELRSAQGEVDHYQTCITRGYREKANLEARLREMEKAAADA